MRIAFLVKSISRIGTGVAVAARDLARNVAQNDQRSLEVLGIEDEFSSADSHQWQPLPTHVFPFHGPAAIRYAPELLRYLQKLDPDVVHTHGLWVYTSMAATKWATGCGRPLVITPHGMLDPWAVKNSRWKKRLAGWLYEHAHLRRAACLHALCDAEADAIRAYGLRSPICVIPNGIDLPAAPPASAPVWQSSLGTDAKVLLFLSRIHPKKGLPGLLRGWSMADHSRGPWHLAIAGGAEVGHEQQLRELSKQLGICETVHFLGPQYAEAKEAAYHHASAFVLPSFSEGLPMVVLEAWANRKPVLMTSHCNLPEGFQSEAAIEISTDPSDIARGLNQLFAMSDAERGDMGERGRKLVEDRFTWARIGSQMREVYDWVIGGGAPPATVTFN